MRIKEMRERKNVSQQEMAQALAVDQSTVCLWETGKTCPRTKLLPKIAQFLDCTVAELFTSVPLASQEVK